MGDEGILVGSLFEPGYWMSIAAGPLRILTAKNLLLDNLNKNVVEDNLARATLPDGLDALRVEMELGDVMRLIERTARWVDPATFRLLPLWYPEYARKCLFYKENWTAPQLNKGEHKQEGNTYANRALTHALGLRSDNRPNWSCCHIWGVDDALFQETNVVVQDRRFFSCVGNMVLLPTPLKAFTDTVPEVKAMIRICARALYGWHCDHESLVETVAVIDRWDDWGAYPVSWPRGLGDGKLPPGVVPLNNDIRNDAVRRLARIRQDLEDAGPHYPRDQVREALAYWKVAI
ncbi:hypothetical protein [Acidocella aminolytica]|uniref:hypothetical protein n=1 Tax=Acidocella aminolytica TaxID=33998 RepID=UPI001F52A3D8|nr:hypothetical protein [Acidocella aminolytica]GBQ39974.1 hypothetical protein AA11237_2230 [Acidocella aminolytica 101 = DSM 11237]